MALQSPAGANLGVTGNRNREIGQGETSEELLRLLGEGWDGSPPLGARGRDPSLQGEGPTQSCGSPGVVPWHWGAEPPSSSCLEKHQRQSRAYSAPRSLTPPHPQRGKNAEGERKKKRIERRAGREKLFQESCVSARQEKPGEKDRIPRGGLQSSSGPGEGFRAWRSAGTLGGRNGWILPLLREHAESRVWG